MSKLGAAMLKVTNALTRLTNDHTDFWVRHKDNLPIGTDLQIDIGRLEGVDVRRIFDVGANRGQTYRSFRSDFPNAEIHCFEPIAEPFAELLQAAKGDENRTVKCWHWETRPEPKRCGSTKMRII